jgi:hypothetical protein
MTNQPPALLDLARRAAEHTDALIDHAPPDVIGSLRLQIDPPLPSWTGQDDYDWTIETDPEGRPVAARKSRMLPDGRLEMITFVHGIEGDRTILDMVSPPGSEEGRS